MKMQSLIVVTALVLAPLASAAPPPDAPPPFGHRAGPPHGHRGPPPQAWGAQAQTQGVVARYLMNPHGEVDGLLLKDGKQIKFPPHVGDELVAAVQPGAAVQVSGFFEYGEQVIKAYSITNTASGQTVVDQGPRWGRPPPHMRGTSLQPMSARGSVTHVLWSPHGVGGAVLDDGTIIRTPPHLAYQYQGLIAPGRSLSVSGYGTQNQYGRVIEASAITAAP